MAEGGFLIKFDGKKALRCYAIAFDYDLWKYKLNNQRKKRLPPGLKKITIEVKRK